MGFPLIFAAVGAAALAGAVAYSKSQNKSSGGGYYTDSSEDIRRAEEQARKEREERERKDKLANLKTELKNQRQQANRQLSILCKSLEGNDLINVSWDLSANKQQLHNLLTQNTSNQLSCDIDDKLLKKSTRDNLGFLQNCNSNISIELTTAGKQACQIYTKCQDSMQQLTDQNSQLEKALRRLKRSTNMQQSA